MRQADHESQIWFETEDRSWQGHGEKIGQVFT